MINVAKQDKKEYDASGSEDFELNNIYEYKFEKKSDLYNVQIEYTKFNSDNEKIKSDVRTHFNEVPYAIKTETKTTFDDGKTTYKQVRQNFKNEADFYNYHWWTTLNETYADGILSTKTEYSNFFTDDPFAPQRKIVTEYSGDSETEKEYTNAENSSYISTSDWTLVE
jgi:hypothetical protein